jgi:hypothetical protein
VLKHRSGTRVLPRERMTSTLEAVDMGDLSSE